MRWFDRCNFYVNFEVSARDQSTALSDDAADVTQPRHEKYGVSVKSLKCHISDIVSKLRKFIPISFINSRSHYVVILYNYWVYQHLQDLLNAYTFQISSGLISNPEREYWQRRPLFAQFNLTLINIRVINKQSRLNGED